MPTIFRAQLVLAAACGLLLCLAASPVAAQVNTESMRIGKERAGRSGFTEVLFAVKDGNTNRVGFGAGFRLQHAVLEEVPQEAEADGGDDAAAGASGEGAGAEEEEQPFRIKRLIFWVTQASFAEEDSETSENNAFSHLRYARRVKPRTQLESFLQWEEDEFQRLDTRWLAGFGARFGLVERSDVALYWGTGYMYESEELDLAPDDPADDETRSHRLTNYLTVKRSRGDGKLNFVNTLYVQPNVEDFDDFRALDEAHLEVALTDKLALHLALVVRHDSDPPIGVEETDVSLTNRFRYSF